MLRLGANLRHQAKRRLFEVLKSQGLQPQHKLCFMSDGEAGVRQLQMHLHPHSDHLLD